MELEMMRKLIKKWSYNKKLGGCKWFLKISSDYPVSVHSCIIGRHFPPKDLTSYSKKSQYINHQWFYAANYNISYQYLINPPMVLHHQFQYILSIYYQPPMVLCHQFQYTFSISYQPPMVLRHQFQWFYATKSNTPDQEQAAIKQTNAW